MKYFIPKNAVLEQIAGEDVQTSIRIIYNEIRTENLSNVCTENFTGHIAVIDLNNKNALPEWLSYTEIEGNLDSGNLRFAENDSYTAPILNEADLARPNHSSLRKRLEWAKAIIEPLVTGENEYLMLFPKSRARLIKERLAECEKQRALAKKAAKSSFIDSTGIVAKLEEGSVIPTHQTVMTWIRKFYQGGMTFAALVPKYVSCGVPYEIREFSNKKPGAKSIIEREKNIRTGVIMNDEWRRKIITGGKMFYENRKQLNLKLAYDLTLQKICAKTDPKTGKTVIPIPEKGEVFTFHQFRYHYQKERKANLRRVLIARHGKHHFNVNLAPRSGTLRATILGPGSLYQVDATIADVILNSPIDRLRIVGRPTFYIVIDAFSKMIVGFSLGLEPEGWLGYRTALINVVEDKVEFCKQHGIDIEPEDWLNTPLPDQIIGDRGAMESKIASSLVDGLGIHLSNTGTNRPDWKAYVENTFAVFNIKIIDYLPGAVPKESHRGDRDYRATGHLTLDYLRQILINTIIDYNKNHRMEKFKMDADMLADNVEPYPAAIYEWGKYNRSVPTRRYSVDEVARTLLPTEEGSVTPDGIYFKNLYYTCERMVEEDWELKAKNLKNWMLQIAYDPRKIEPIYIRTGHGGEMLECILKDRNSPFIGYSRSEVDSYLKRNNLNNKQTAPRKRQTDSDLRVTNEKVMKKSKKEFNQAKKNSPPQTDYARLKAIDKNKKDEIFSRDMIEQELFASEVRPLEETGNSDESQSLSIKPKKHQTLQELMQGKNDNESK